eukprot:TRINITY_DN2241_c1_g1_i1.p1 TRINITY_DN2241_c1_g1~~TRINITY_DN2241_c1_g1_i1.p1  ORF type:complete len:941 (+),score=273.30 TRINITY_DN2241_c1_g1_i1:34-2823(+)
MSMPDVVLPGDRKKQSADVADAGRRLVASLLSEAADARDCISDASCAAGLIDHRLQLLEDHCERVSIGPRVDQVSVCARLRPSVSTVERRPARQPGRDEVREIKGGIRAAGDDFLLPLVHSPGSTQQEVYSVSGPPLLRACLNGYNACILAYGATGSGKTHTIMGPANCSIPSLPEAKAAPAATRGGRTPTPRPLGAFEVGDVVRVPAALVTAGGSGTADATIYRISSDARGLVLGLCAGRSMRPPVRDVAARHVLENTGHSVTRKAASASGAGWRAAFMRPLRDPLEPIRTLLSPDLAVVVASFLRFGDILPPQTRVDSSGSAFRAVLSLASTPMSTVEGEWGVVPRLCADLFMLAADKGVTIRASFVEVYNEQVYDLLTDSEWSAAPRVEAPRRRASQPVVARRRSSDASKKVGQIRRIASSRSWRPADDRPAVAAPDPSAAASSTALTYAGTATHSAAGVFAVHGALSVDSRTGAVTGTWSTGQFSCGLVGTWDGWRMRWGFRGYKKFSQESSQMVGAVTASDLSSGASVVLKGTNDDGCGVSFRIVFTVADEPRQDPEQEPAPAAPTPPNFPRVTVDPQTGATTLIGARCPEVGTWSEVSRLLVSGNAVRATAATWAHDRSSRSHAIFTLLLQQQDGRTSKLHVVDLAGSERAGMRAINTYQLQEGCQINLSLLVLGRVINSLAEKHKHVPFRDSVLTSILRDSLQGRALCHFIGTVSPDDPIETGSTLRLTSQSVSKIQDAGKADWKSFPSRIRSRVRELSDVYARYQGLAARLRRMYDKLRELDEPLRALLEEDRLRGSEDAEHKSRLAQAEMLQDQRRAVRHAATSIEMEMMYGWAGKKSVKASLDQAAARILAMEAELSKRETQGHRCRTQLLMGEDDEAGFDCLAELFSDIRSCFSLVEWKEIAAAQSSQGDHTKTRGKR